MAGVAGVAGVAEVPEPPGEAGVAGVAPLLDVFELVEDGWEGEVLLEEVEVLEVDEVVPDGDEGAGVDELFVEAEAVELPLVEVVELEVLVELELLLDEPELGICCSWLILRVRVSDNTRNRTSIDKFFIS